MLAAIFISLITRANTQQALTIADNTANPLGSTSFTGLLGGLAGTISATLCAGSRVGAGMVLSTSYVLRELDVAVYAQGKTTEAFGYPVYVTVEAWNMSSSTVVSSRSPIISTTVMITTLPGNQGTGVSTYIRIPLNNNFLLAANSSFPQGYLITVNFLSVCSSALMFGMSKPTITPTPPGPQNGVTGGLWWWRWLDFHLG